MIVSQSCASISLAFLVATINAQDLFDHETIAIAVGEDDTNNPSSVGWTDGVCYIPITGGVYPGDTLEFVYDAHNVYKMASKQHFLDCDFTDAELLSQVGESPFSYEVPADENALYFACEVLDHCGSGTQKLQVAVSSFFGNPNQRPPTISSYVVGASVEECQALQESPGGIDETAFLEQQRLQSECSDALLGQDGYYTRSCLSGAATLTPGGVINRLFVMQYPYPRDHRVAVGQRTFEFVYDNVDGTEGVTPAPINQLYVHHLSGRIIFGQGAEGVRQEAPDAPFAYPYFSLTGDEGDSMIFHLIDLREVDDWLACLECRCPSGSEMTYLDDLTNTGNLTGGVNCCSNCTDLTGPTLDYRMRYNISYRELDDDEPVRDTMMLVADISPAAGKRLEHDVPSWEYLPEDQRAEYNLYIQRLERVEPFNVMFKQEFFERDYDGPAEVGLLRCVAHLHVAAIDMWLEDVETGEMLCSGSTVYGKDPKTDAGFLIAINVDDHDPPITFPADRMVRFVTEYNATELHTGVMGYYFIFIEGESDLTRKEVNLTVDMCMQPTCDVSMLPAMDTGPVETVEVAVQSTGTGQDCVDTLAESPSCTFGGLCDCDSFVNAAESSGCDGVYRHASQMGDIEVRSVCANYCGCEGTATGEQTSTGGPPSVGGCADSLGSHPMCQFGSICECEEFVSAPESEGCGGLYRSDFGDVVINDVCPQYCDACVEVSIEEQFEEVYVEAMTQQAREKCHYATAECQAILSNMYSCGSGQPGIETADPMIQAVVTKRGQEVAMDSAQLGHNSLHGGEDPQEVEACSSNLDPPDGGDDSSRAVSLVSSFGVVIVVLGSSLAILG